MAWSGGWGTSKKLTYDYDHPDDSSFQLALARQLKANANVLRADPNYKSAVVKRGFYNPDLNMDDVLAEQAAADKAMADLDDRGINQLSVNQRKAQLRGSKQLTASSKPTQGERSSMANSYEPGLFSVQNGFNTQATRDVGGGKSGVVGNEKAGNAVYNPKSNTRTAVSKMIKSRGQKLTAERKSRKLDRSKERLF